MSYLDWLYLILAILFETAGTTALKLSEGFTRLVPSLLMVLCYAVSFGVFALALKRIDVGVGYAIWVGLGAALIAAIGVVVFKEQLPVPKLLSLCTSASSKHRLSAVGAPRWDTPSAGQPVAVGGRRYRRRAATHHSPLRISRATAATNGASSKGTSAPADVAAGAEAPP